VLLLRTRRSIIEWAGRVHAFPVAVGNSVDFAQHGPEAAAAKRTGWRGFFEVLEPRHLAVAIDGIDAFEHRVIELSKAHAELPPQAFGPPWYRALWHEIVLR
jgi:hypothetical protein